MPRPPANLVVQRLDGSQLEIALEDQTARDIKDEICKHWHVPPLFQQLVVASTILDDVEKVRAHSWDDDAPILVTMLTTFDGINADLRCRNVQTQKRALTALSDLAADGKCGQLLKTNASQVLVRLVQEQDSWDADLCVRCQAVKALGRAAQQGEFDAISAVCVCVSDMDQSIRNAAVKALGMLREGQTEQHEHAILVLSSYLDHPIWQIRCAAVKGLDSFTKVGNKDAIALVKDLVTDPDDSVRMVAVRAHNRLAQLGSNRGSVAACNPIPAVIR
jgi:HEAT repeat protein